VRSTHDNAHPFALSRAPCAWANAPATDIEREIGGLKREEATLTADIKAAAKRGDTATARLLAQQLVRLRGTQTRLRTGQAQLRGAGTACAAAAATASVARGMAAAGAAMKAVNASASASGAAQAVADFARSAALMDANAECMGDVMDDLMASDGEEEETDALVAQARGHTHALRARAASLSSSLVSAHFFCC
jgi:division protein CdvB (Snf7/Vps24/ESCRT-III family)